MNLSNKTTSILLSIFATLLCGELHAQNCVPQPSGLVSWWKGESAADDMVDGNSGVLMNGIGFTTGMVGQAFNLDGNDDYIRVADSANLHFTSAMTAEAWLYPTTFAGS